MKTVEYMGKGFEVPDWAKYIAADGNGAVYVFDKEPFWVSNDSVWMYVEGSELKYIGFVDLQPKLKEI